MKTKLDDLAKTLNVNFKDLTLIEKHLIFLHSDPPCLADRQKRFKTVFKTVKALIAPLVCPASGTLLNFI